MSDVAISVENLGKQYRIGTRERHDTLRDAVAARFARRDRSDSDLCLDSDLAFRGLYCPFFCKGDKNGLCTGCLEIKKVVPGVGQ